MGEEAKGEEASVWCRVEGVEVMGDGLLAIGDWLWAIGYGGKRRKARGDGSLAIGDGRGDAAKLLSLPITINHKPQTINYNFPQIFAKNLAHIKKIS